MKRYSALVGILLVCLAVTALLVGCSGGQGSGSNTTTAPAPSEGSTTGSTVTVTEKNLAFNPASVSVKVGDTVTFTNADSAPHEVNIDGKDLGRQENGASVTWTAEKAGTFDYKCIIHPSMTGQVLVK